MTIRRGANLGAGIRDAFDLSGDAAAEATRALAAESVNGSAITTEATTRAANDSSEASTRASADSALTTSLATEASTRATADTTNATAISTETTRATAAEALKAPKLTPTAVQTGAYSASAGDLVPVDTTSGAVSITLPAAPADGARVAVKHVIQGGTNAVTVLCAGSDVYNKTSGATSATLPLVAQAIQLQYKASGAIWYVVADDLPLASLDARYNGTFVATIGGANALLGWQVVTDATFGAVPATLVTDAAVSASSSTVSSPGGHFTPAMNGQFFLIEGAGTDWNAGGANPWGGSPLIGTFTYVSATSGTLSAPAAVTVTGARMSIGPAADTALAAALAVGKTVYIPDNVDLFVTGEVSVGSYQCLRGAGRRSRVISVTTNGNVITSGLTTEPTVRDLAVVGTGPGTQPANTTPGSGNPNWAGAGCGVIFAGVTRGLVENVAAINCGGNGTAPNNGVGGFWITYGCVHTTVTGCYAFQCRNGINEDNYFNSITEHVPLNNTIRGNVVEYCEFGIAQDSGSNTRGLLIDGNVVRYCIQSGIDCHRSRYVRVVNNVCSFNGANYTNAGIIVYGDSVSITFQRADIANNVCFSNGTHGIKVSTNVDAYVLQGNICASNFRHGIYLNLSANNSVLSGNLCVNNGQGNDSPGSYDGIRATSCTNVLAAGNRSYNTGGTTQNYGFRADGSSDYIDLSGGNDFTGNQVAPVAIVGSNSRLVAKHRDSVLRAACGSTGESFPRAAASGSFAPAAGDFRIAAVGLVAGDVVTNVHLHVTVVGSGVTLAKVALMDSTGKVLARSADVSSSMTSGTGEKSLALSSPYAVTADGAYYLGLVTVGGTSATILRGTSGITGMTTATTGGPMLGGNVTSQTDVTVGATPAFAASSTAPWFGWN